MTEKMKSRRAEGYIDICVGVVCFVMILVIAVNLFSFVSLRVEMDKIADDLLASATYSGAFDTEFNNTKTYYLNNSFAYDVTYGADAYYNSTYKRVQLGERMWVTVSVQTAVKGLGVFSVPVTVSVTKSGLSEKYWK